ncbi:hypothetical protein CRUP_001365, partial [Coryphaenoides rupestris]
MEDLLLRCRRRLYARGSRQNVRLTDAQIVTDISWEKLNTGTWRDVDKEWRRVYAYGCLFKALALLCGGGGRREGQGEGEGEGPGAERVRQAVRTCDLGLLMGASVLDGVLQRLVRVLQTDVRRRARAEEEAQTKSPEAEVQAKKIKLEIPSAPVMKPNAAIPRTRCPSLEHFRTNNLLTQQPVILEGIISHWPALNHHSWSLDYIRSIAGCRTVPVE